MMPPLAPLLVVLAVAALAAAYVALGWVGALALGAVALLGALVGLLLPERRAPAPRPATVRKVAPPRAAAAKPGAARAVTSFVPVRGAAIAMEPGAARLQDPHEESLRLTGDILRGMRTGGKTTRGKCSQCSATLWLSARRPVKARCPVCGFSRVLT